MNETKILIVGAGPAGFAAAKAASKNCDDIVICGKEAYAPYWRTRLPSVIGNNTDIDNLSMAKADWFKSNNIKFISNLTMSTVDTANSKVIWTDGTCTRYQKLILALGAFSYIPQLNYEGEIFTLREYDDAIKIREKALEKKKAVIVGGGLLGLEIAFQLKSIGVSVTVIERDNYILARQLDQPGGEFLVRKISEDGLQIITGANASDYLHLLKHSCVVVAAGIRSNIQVLKNTDIEYNRAVVVNENMQTSVKNVFACGDIAEYQGKCWGLITIASSQGRVAGSNAADIEMKYQETLPAPMLKISKISVMSIGDISVENNKVLRFSNNDVYQAFSLENNKLVGAVFIGDTTLGFKAKNLIEKEISIPDLNSFNELTEFIRKY